MRIGRLIILTSLVTTAVGGCGRGSQTDQSAPQRTRAAQSPSAAAPAAPAAAPFGTGDLGDYPVPVPVDTVARVSDVPRVETKQIAATATTQAVEIRVEGYQEVASLNGRPAPSGRTFLVVDTSWKNIIPLRPAAKKSAARGYGAGGLGFGVAKESAPPAEEAPLEPTPYLVGNVPQHLWLVTDNRYTDPIDVQATAQVPGHLPTNRLMIARLGEVVKGKVVFDAPAGARYMALQFLDTTYGHALVPLKGTPESAPLPKTLTPPQQNELLELAVTDALWATSGPPAPDGFKYFIVSLRGVSRSQGDIVQVEIGKYLFVTDDQAFVTQPEPNANWLSRPFRGLTPFLPAGPNEGQAVFLLPADTERTMLLWRPPAGGSLDLPAPDRVKPAWPAPVATIADGGTLHLHALPLAQAPTGLREPPAGRQYVVLDLVAENQQPKGVELQPNQQFRIQDASGAIYLPLPETNRLSFHLTGRGVVPGGGARRFQLLYVVPAGQSLRLAYRGFEKTDTIDLR